MKKFLLLMLGALLALSEHAQATTVNYTYEGTTLVYDIYEEDQTAYVGLGGYTEYIDVSGDVIIPSSFIIDDIEYTVKGISSYAFRLQKITSLVLPNTVKFIDKDAFFDGSVKRIAAPFGCNIPYGIGATVVSYPAEGATEENGWIYGAEKTAIYYAPYGLSGEVVIPETITSVSGFKGLPDITTIKLHKSVTNIGDEAFDGCTGLTSIDLPESVTTIGIEAFRSCTSLTSLNLPNSITSIGIGAFAYCDNLTSINLPKSLSTIEISLFEGCKRLTEVKIPESVSKIGKKAFNDTGLTWAVLPNPNEIEIENNAFQDSKSLFGIIINAKRLTLGGDVFNGTMLNKIAYRDKLVSDNDNIKNIPYKWTIDQGETVDLERGIIWGVSKAETPFVTGLYEGELVIPSEVTSITWGCMAKCDKITKVVLPSTLETIGAQSFLDCTGLTSITIPATVTKIYQQAFYGCDNLKEVVCLGETPAEADRETFTETQYNEAKLFVPVGAKEAYDWAAPWSYFRNVAEGTGSSGIDDVIEDSDAKGATEVYNLSGVKVGNATDNLPAGLYIVRQGNTVKKVAVK